jgi:hypothetical protein
VSKENETPRTDGRRSAKRSAFFDPRFVIGLVLVLASVGGVYAIVSAADRSTEVFVARGALVVGEIVHADDLVAAEVRLGGAGHLYLKPEAIPHEGVVMTRTVRSGELVPTSAVDRVGNTSTTSVVVTTERALSGSIEPGTVVDVWSADRTEREGYGPPVVLVGGASVVRVLKEGGLVADPNAVSVELRVPDQSVAEVLEALANDSALSVVPSNRGSAAESPTSSRDAAPDSNSAG